MAPQMVKMRIVKDNHTHGDEVVEKGTVIEVPDFRSAWMTKHGIAVPVVEERKTRRRKKDQAEEAPAEAADQGEENAPSEE